MRITNAIALGIGLAVLPAAVAQAQLRGLGEAAQQGATDAVKKQVVEGIVGTPTPTAIASPSAASPAPTTSPAATPRAAATSPAMAASPAASASPITAQDAGRMLMEQAGKKVAPKVP
jgi:hypothetical protein